jgi:DNA-binding transcriptional LysR family regulator
MLNRLEMMRIFCVTAESNSFKEAAVRLGISPQAVTRAIKQLEQTVGEPLFYRNTRQMRITDFGVQLASRAKDMVSGIDALFTTANDQQDSSLAGTVRITAPVVIGRRFLLPVLSEIAARHPEIVIDLRLSDAITDAIEQQIDIGVRVGFLRDSSFVARSPAKVSFFSVGAPSLIARVGKPKSIDDLLDMPTTGLVDSSTGRCWPWYFSDGHQFTPKATAFITDDAETELDLVLNGIGFAQVPGCLAIPLIHSGRLVTVLGEHQAPPWDLYVYRPQRGPVPTRTRLVYDRLLQTLGDPARFPVTL